MAFEEKIEEFVSNVSEGVDKLQDGIRSKFGGITGGTAASGAAVVAKNNSTVTAPLLAHALVGNNAHVADMMASSKASSSDTLLEVLRSFYSDPRSVHCTISAEKISEHLSSVNVGLSKQWANVAEFVEKAFRSYEEGIRIIHNELEIYAQSSVVIEEQLANVVRNVLNESNRILAKLGITH